MENYDAFVEGIEPGGLRSRGEIKLLICYIVSKIDSGITKTQLNEVLTSKGIANYFEVNQALSEVLKSGNVTYEIADEDEVLYPTELGRYNARELENDLPYSIKEEALHTAVEMLTRAKREQENKIEIEKHGNGYDVTVSILDNDDELLSVKLYVADLAQAESVKSKFLDDPVRAYSTIVALLMA